MQFFGSTDVFVGYRHYQKQRHEPLFSFGYGLSYTEFEYSNLHITPVDDDLDIALIDITVSNIGERSGSEVVQVYIGKLPASVPTPSRQLAGFARVTLDPDESSIVSIPISRQTASFFWISRLEHGVSLKEPSLSLWAMPQTTNNSVDI